MRAIMTIMIIVFMALPATAGSDDGSPIVLCESGRWDGSATWLDDSADQLGKATVDKDWTTYPERVYYFSRDNKTALIKQGRFKWTAVVVAEDSSSRTISFSIAGERYLDLVENDGTVFTTYIRFRPMGRSSAHAFVRKCIPLR